MKPILETKTTLVDLLDRLLDKGLVLHADLIVTMGDVPLIAINLRAIVAGAQTLLDYGMMPGQIQNTSVGERKNLELINK